MKRTNLYYLSVEGWNEKWYFEHLQKLINNSDQSAYYVKFDIKIDKSPLSRKKSINVPIFPNQKLQVFHIVDYESNDYEHTKQFIGILDELKTIRSSYKAYDYKLGYSNFSFELWLILHKSNSLFSVQDRSKYIDHINDLYGTNLVNIKNNKSEERYKNLLKQINLDDVERAVNNARKIRLYQKNIGNSMAKQD